MLRLLEETAGLALDLLEKNGALVPFFKLRNRTWGMVILMGNVDDGDGPIPEEEIEKCVNSSWSEIKRRVAAGEIAEFAFISDKLIQLQNESVQRRFLRVEFQDGSTDSAVYLFPLSVDNGRAHLGAYLLADLPEKVL